MTYDDYEEIAPGFTGRYIEGTYSTGLTAAVRQLREDEQLFFVHDRVIDKVPIPIGTQEDFDAAYAQHSQGLSMYYKLAASARADIVTVLVQEDDDSPVEIHQRWVQNNE